MRTYLLKSATVFLFTAIILTSFFNVNVQANADRSFLFEKDTFSFRNYSEEPISYSEAHEALKSADWTASYPSWSLELLANVAVEMNMLQSGYCFGMAYTAKHYYENPEVFKTNYPECSNLIEVKKDQISPEIKTNQLVQYVTQPYYFNGILLILEMPNMEEQIPYILEQLDNNHPVIIGLDVNGGKDFKYHAVLAYNYTLADEREEPTEEVTLNMYDSNFPNEIQTIKFCLNQTGQYNISEECVFIDIYKATKLTALTYYKADWDLVIQHREELEQFILNSQIDTIPIEEILTILAIIGIVTVTVIIFLVVILRKK